VAWWKTLKSSVANVLCISGVGTVILLPDACITFTVFIEVSVLSVGSARGRFAVGVEPHELNMSCFLWHVNGFLWLAKKFFIA
jgi:hypothetical protein